MVGKIFGIEYSNIVMRDGTDFTLQSRSSGLMQFREDHVANRDDCKRLLKFINFDIASTHRREHTKPFSWPNDTDGMAARLTIERSRRYPENVGTVSQARDRSN